MKTRFTAMLGILLAAGLMIAGCAKPSVYPEHMSPRPFYNDTWWGSDPVCSPGCPTGMGPGW